MRKNKLLKTIFICTIVSLSISANSCAKSSLSETAALSKIESLPEIQLFVGEVKKSGTDIKPTIRQESVDTSDLFEYYIGESRPTHDVLWNRFAINKKTAEIFVFDVESGDYIPLGEWRNKQK